jgi:L-malate glycosyltransferase
MNILILISTLNYGGAEKQVMLDANMLSKEHTIYLCTFYGGPLEGQLSDKVRKTQVKKSSYFTTAIRIARLVKKNDIQIIHAHLFASSVIAALASLICKVKVIWHMHGHRYEDENNGQRTLSLLSKLPQVRKLLFVSTELIGYFADQGYKFPAKKCMLMFNSSQLQASKKTRSDGDNFVIGFIGRLVELKRVEFLLELAAWMKAKGLSDFCIDIVGDGPELKKLKEMSLQLKVDDKVNFRGFQSDTASYYATFDLFILPSREECLSLALIDAGMLGIPSIAFQVGGNDEIIKQGETGYIVNQKEELFEKTYYLYTNKNERISMGKAAGSYCSSVFGEEHHLKALLSVYAGI